MFANLSRISCAYTIAIVNFLFSLSPYMIFFAPLLFMNVSNAAFLMQNLVLMVFFIASIFIAFHILMDYLFGFGVMKETVAKRDVKSYKNGKFVKFFKEIDQVFKESKKIFNTGPIELFIKKDPSPNAYAVGSVRTNAIILTTGLLNLIYSQSQSREDCIRALQGVIGHEMSHIVNRDFLPGAIIRITLASTNKSVAIMHFVINVIFFIVNKIPFIGKITYYLGKFIYKLSAFFSSFTLKYILMPTYDFLDIFLSKSMEFRADSDSAKAFGAKSMATVLYYLGENSYHSIFYHHPSIPNRINRLKNKNFRQVKSFIPNPITNFVNLGSIFVLFTFPYFIGSFLHVERMGYVAKLSYEAIHYNINYAIIALLDLKSMLLSFL